MYSIRAAARFFVELSMDLDLVASNEKELELQTLFRPLIDSMGFELVRLRLGGRNAPVLQVMAERRQGGMSVDDCASLSRALSILLEVEDPIASNYTLEVSSPGIDRPLTKTEHFRDWSGHLAKIEVAPPIDGQRRFRGCIADVQDGAIGLETKTGRVDLPLGSVAKAKLVITDELLAAHLDSADGKGPRSSDT
ncbi:MAG: ribosome maturation factor RimP [Rhodobacteraceae bacterium]|nr:ribosome maturation factor RimP [Paracoccaceae bacterium]